MAALKGRDLLSLADLNTLEVQELLHLAAQLKAGVLNLRCNKVLGLCSTKLRLGRVSPYVPAGWQVIDLNPDVTQVSRGEPVQDTARVLDRYLDILAIGRLSSSN